MRPASQVVVNQEILPVRRVPHPLQIALERRRHRSRQAPANQVDIALEGRERRLEVVTRLGARRVDLDPERSLPAAATLKQEHQCPLPPLQPTTFEQRACDLQAELEHVRRYPWALQHQVRARLVRKGKAPQPRPGGQGALRVGLVLERVGR